MRPRNESKEKRLSAGNKIIIRWFFRIGGILMITNAFWMEFSAHHWFKNIPADLAATGEPNIHFIRDVALAYLVFGIGLYWCANNIHQCRLVFMGVALFTVGHAINHVIEILFGQLPHSHWWIDFPLVFLPGILLGVLALPQVWRKIIAN